MCDKKGPTLTVYKTSQGKVFGGYTSLSWKSCFYPNRVDHKAFIFSLTNKTKHEIYRNKKYAVYDSLEYFPSFGEARDIYVVDKCDT